MTKSQQKLVKLEIKYRFEKLHESMEKTRPGEGAMTSKSVLSPLAPRAVFLLRVYPGGFLRSGEMAVQLSLTGNMKREKESLDATYHIYLISGAEGELDSIHRGTFKFGERSYQKTVGAPHHRVKKALRADGSLLVAADVEFLVPCDGEGVSTPPNYEDLKRWAVGFSELYGDTASSDCTIEIGGESISAHKTVLMAQSRVFRHMFSHKAGWMKSKELMSGVVKVTDFKEPEPMRAVVRYCYKGHLSAEEIEDGGEELFWLADKYCIDSLKALLEKHYVEKALDEGNVIGMAELADSCSAAKLKEACIKLIAEKRQTIFTSARWARLKETRPKLALELAEKVAAMPVEKN